jgi:hypothetical protein
VTADFDKQVYRTDDDVHFTFKLKNVGETPAVGLQVAQWMTDPTDLMIPFLDGWGKLRLPPGSRPSRGRPSSCR